MLGKSVLKTTSAYVSPDRTSIDISVVLVAANSRLKTAAGTVDQIRPIIRDCCGVRPHIGHRGLIKSRIGRTGVVCEPGSIRPRPAYPGIIGR